MHALPVRTITLGLADSHPLAFKSIQDAATMLQQASALRMGQIIALRFAGDDELEELVRAVLAGKLTKNIEIKGAIEHWRADTFRV